MAEYLVIRLAADPDRPADWIAVDSDGTRLGPPVTGALTGARADMRDRRVIALIPGADVLTTSVDLPVKGTRLLAALPFALEESLADDVDTLHFAAGERQANGRYPVSVISHERMLDWLGQLRDAGIEPSRVVAEQYGLARIPGTASVLLDGDQVIVNDGADNGFMLQDVTPGDALVALGLLSDGNRGDDEDGEDSGDARPRHALVYCEADNEERYRHDWNALRHELDSLDVKLLPDGVLPRLAATVATGAGVNLLQGAYGPKTGLGSLFAPWKYAAMLLLAVLLVGTAEKAVSYVALSRDEADLREQFHAEYRQLVPGAPEVADPARVVDSLRARAGGGNAAPQLLLQTLQHLSRALQNNADARIEAISFRAGVADIRVNAASVSVLDDIRKRVDESGRFRARIQSMDQAGERVNSRLQIQAVSE